jgi:N-acetylmuramoyl-L-alanine amidase
MTDSAAEPHIIERPSPNFGERPAGVAIDTLVIHYTGMQTAEAALERLCDPEAKVSAHYTIGEDGTAWRLVAEEARAWHAGVSSWRGGTDLNDRSIGIELVNPGHEWGYRDFPDAQMQKLIGLAHAILTRHPIPQNRIVGHSDIAPLRKDDPGEKFDWKRMAEAGIGLWPNVTLLRPVMVGDSEMGEAIRLLAAIGYGIDEEGGGDGALLASLRAFQRRFRQKRVDGILDGETLLLLRAVAELMG